MRNFTDGTCVLFNSCRLLNKLRCNASAILGDQMGLGKTVQALALMSCYEEDWPCLILVPTSLRDAWHEALRRWLNVRPALIASIGSVSVITFVPPLRSLVPYTNTQSPPNY